MTYVRFYFALSNIYWTIIGQLLKSGGLHALKQLTANALHCFPDYVTGWLSMLNYEPGGRKFESLEACQKNNERLRAPDWHQWDTSPPMQLPLEPHLTGVYKYRTPLGTPRQTIRPRL